MSREFRHEGCMILQQLSIRLGVEGVVRYGYMGGGGERVFYLSTGPLDPPVFLADSVTGSARRLHEIAVENLQRRPSQQ